MKKVLIVLDRPGWAFDAIAKQLESRVSSFEIDLFYLKGDEPDRLPSSLEERYHSSDLVFFMHWSLALQPQKRLLSFGSQSFAQKRLRKRFPYMDYQRALIGIHSHHDYDDRKSLPDRDIPPPENLVDALSEFRAINCVSRRLKRVFEGAGVEKVHYTPNGVDHESFKPTQGLGQDRKLVVGCSGTKKRDWKEGITEFVEPLAKLDFVDLRLAIPQEGKYVPHEEMPLFLNSIDVSVCASSSEGFPLKVIEPLSCGRPVLSTKVGGVEDLLRQGETGYFVERRVGAFVDRLADLHRNREKLREMGSLARKDIESNWTWDRRASDWIRFIEEFL